MTFLYHDLYSIYLLFVFFLISICFNTNRKQIKSLLLLPFKTKESYEYLYFQRNMNLSFVRFLYFIIIVLISSPFITLLKGNLKIFDFFDLLWKVIVFFIAKYAAILLFGFTLNKYVKFKKVSIINIDVKTFISIYFFPVLLVISYANVLSYTLIYIISLIFIMLMVITKIVFIIKSNKFIGLKFIDIISYICILEIIPIIALYTILK